MTTAQPGAEGHMQVGLQRSLGIRGFKLLHANVLEESRKGSKD